MAAKRVTKSAVDWAAFLKTVPDNQLRQFNAFKAKSMGYSGKMSTLPEALPALDWSAYEAKVKVPSMVAEFKKQYESITIPYPKDTYSAQIDDQKKEVTAKLAVFIKDAEATIAANAIEVVRVEKMSPQYEMTMQEFFEAYPEELNDSFLKPAMWPNLKEFQPEYINQMEAEGKFDEH